MTHNDAFRQIIAQSSFFQKCGSNFLEKCESESQLIKAPKNKIVFITGDHAQRFYVIRSGWIKVFRETEEGEQAVLYVLGEGEIIGECAIFNDNKYPYSAEATEDCELFSLSLAVLRAEIDSNHAMAIHMLNTQAKRNWVQDREIEHRTLQNAPQRIGCFILRHANPSAKGKTSIQLPFDKTLLAARLGMQPETFSRALSKLKTEANLTVKGSIIEIEDVGTLSKYCCSACSSTYPCEDLPQ